MATPTRRGLRRSRWGVISEWCAAHQILGFTILSIAYVFSLYWRALGAPFIYDDLSQIVNNVNLTSFHAVFKSAFLTPTEFTSNFRAGGGSTYRPLFWLSLSVGRHIWGLRASGFHFTNIFLHWANGFLLYLLLRRMHISTAIAATAVIIWLGMPINSEPVAWISGREYLMCGLFLILALWSAYSYLYEGRTTSLIGVLAFLLAALFSHESGILFLPLAIIFVYSAGKLRKRTGLILLSVVIVADLLFLLARRIVGIHAEGGKSTIWPVGLAFWKYMLWMVAPIHMSMQRATSTPPNVPSAQAILALCSLLALCIGIILVRKKTPLLSAGLAWSIAALLPFCGIVFIYQGMAERFEYFASAGLALAIASVVVQYAKTLKLFATVIVILWVAWGAWRLQRRVRDWCDPISLYESSLEATSDPMLFYNLGCAWRDKGDLNKALEEYLRAVQIRPDYEEAQAGVGQILFLLHRYAEALTPFNRALVLSPTDSATRVTFALSLEALGENEESEGQFKKALMFTPKNTSALNDFGSFLISEGRSDEAIPYFQQAIQANPRDTTAYYNLAAFYQNHGQNNKALQMYQRLLQTNPNDSEAITNMMRIYRH